MTTVVVVGVVVLLYLLSQTQNSLFSPKEIQPTPTVAATPTLSAQSPKQTNPALYQKLVDMGYEPLWIDPTDNTGRTAMYAFTSQRQQGYEGIGEKTYTAASGQAHITELIGRFDRYEDIPSSQDKYLVLYDPRTKAPLPKVRVVTNPKLVKEALASTTMFFEYLHPLSDNVSLLTDSIGSLDKVGYFKLNNAMQKGDAVIVLFIGAKDGGNRVDENGKLIAFSLVFRRLLDITPTPEKQAF